MEFLKSDKFRIVLNIIVIILLIALIVITVFVFLKKEDKTTTTSNDIVALKEDKTKNVEEKKEEDKAKLYVDIKGAIKKPGVYEVSENMIINDVIKLAGGLKSNASTKYVNLSKKVTDQMVIYIYTVSQIKKISEPSSEPCVVETEDISKCEGSSIIETSPSNDNSSTKEQKNSSIENNNQTSSKININTASVDELVTLNGIGEAKAKSIIEYRETNGSFKTIEDIMNVSGIGEAAYNKIKDNITV